MTITNPRRGIIVDHRLCDTGAPAAWGVGMALQQDQLHMRRWSSLEHIAEYVGRPDESCNGNLSDGAAGSETVGTFYITTAFPVRVDAATTATRDVAIVVKRWRKDYTAVGGIERWEWYPDYTGAADTPPLVEQAASLAAPDDDYETAPTGDGFTRIVSVTPTTSNNGLRLSKLTVTRALPACVLAFGVPHDDTCTEDEAIVPAANVAVGQTLRGYDTGAAVPAGDSIGAIAHYTNQTTDGCAQNTRRCLFQTPYILGAWGIGTGAESSFRKDLGGNAMSYKVTPRNLRNGAANIDCIPAIVFTCGAGTEGDKIVFRSSAGTWGYAITAADEAAGWCWKTAADAGGTSLPVDPDGDYVTVSHEAAAGNTIALHTCALWEPSGIT